MSKLSDYIISERYAAEVQARLEPDPLIVRGNAKRYTPLWTLPVPKPRTAEELEAMEDAYLLKHGIK